MAVLGTAPFLQFFDDDGNPLAGGKIYTYAATTTTPKATYTDAGGGTPADNPIDLDSSGIPDTANGSIWLEAGGAYKFVVEDSLGNIIRTTDNVTAFSIVTSTSPSLLTVADAGGDTTTWPILGLAQTGSTSPSTDSGLTYNSSTNVLTVSGGVNVGGSTLNNFILNSYTPTLTNTTNIAASTAFATYYMRINSYVLVFGRIDIDPTATGVIELDMSLPIASNLSATNQAGGTAVCTAVNQALGIRGNSTSDALTFRGVATDASDQAYQFNAWYLIL